MRRTDRRRPARDAERDTSVSRLDQALITRYPELSRRRARSVIERGQVRIDGETVLDPGRRVAPGATIDWDVNRPTRPRARCSLDLLFEDRWLVVVDKPAGLLSVPSVASRRATEDSALRRVDSYAARLRRQAGAVHRLDRDTSGALAFALDQKVRAALRREFRAHHVERRYLAIVRGVPLQSAGVVDRPVALEYAAGRRRLARGDEPALAALTRWRVVEPLQGAALVEVRLETGRQHQIRLHMASLGHPVLGDQVYGAERGQRDPAARQLLHAGHLGLPHPVTGVWLSVDSPLPADFGETLRRLRRRA